MIQNNLEVHFIDDYMKLSQNNNKINWIEKLFVYFPIDLDCKWF